MSIAAPLCAGRTRRDALTSCLTRYSNSERGATFQWMAGMFAPVLTR